MLTEEENFQLNNGNVDKEKLVQREVTLDKQREEMTAEELEQRKALKREIVADTLKAHPLFKTMKASMANNNVNIDGMLEAIVERYFEESGNNDDYLLGEEFFEVNETFITMALDQTIYLINVKEQFDVILHSNGELDEEATEAQRKAFDFLGEADTNTKEFFLKALEQGSLIENMLNSSKTGHADQVLFDIGKMNSAQLDKFWRGIEGKEVLDNTLNSDKMQQGEKTSRSKSYLYTAEEVEVMKLCQEITDISTKKTISAEDRKKIYEKMQRLEKFKDGAAKDLLNENGKIDVVKSIEKYRSYAKEYSIKESIKVLEEFGKNRKIFEKYSPEQQKAILEAIYVLKSQDNKEYQTEALIAASTIPGLTIKNGFRIEEIDEHVFITLYNAYRNGRNVTERNIKNILFESVSEDAKEQVRKLKVLVDKGEFSEEEAIANANKKNKTSKLTELARKEEQSTDQKDSLGENQETKKKSKISNQIFTMLRTNYRRGKMHKADNIIDSIMRDLKPGKIPKDKFQEDKVQVMIKAYKACIEELKSDNITNKARKANLIDAKALLEEYILNDPVHYGKIIDMNKKGERAINPKKVNDAAKNKSNEPYFSDEGIDIVIGIMGDVSAYKRTLGFAIRGGFEIVKDIISAGIRRGEAHPIRLPFFKKPKALPEATNSKENENNRTIKNMDVLKSIQDVIDTDGNIEDIELTQSENDRNSETDNDKEEVVSTIYPVASENKGNGFMNMFHEFTQSLQTKKYLNVTTQTQIAMMKDRIEMKLRNGSISTSMENSSSQNREGNKFNQNYAIDLKQTKPLIINTPNRRHIMEALINKGHTEEEMTNVVTEKLQEMLMLEGGPKAMKEISEAIQAEEKEKNAGLLTNTPEKGAGLGANDREFDVR